MAQLSLKGAKSGTYIRRAFIPKAAPAYGSYGGARTVALTQAVVSRFPVQLAV